MRIYKEKIEKKKLADQLIIKDFHLVPMITNSNDISNVSALSKGGFSMHTNPVIMIARC